MLDIAYFVVYLVCLINTFLNMSEIIPIKTIQSSTKYHCDILDAINYAFLSFLLFYSINGTCFGPTVRDNYFFRRLRFLSIIY